jgi:hypothetical protein
MIENEMVYRGSKSLCSLIFTLNCYPCFLLRAKGIKIRIKKKSVKEQRVDGSYIINKNKNLMVLRYTLMGFERNYQTKISSKQFVIQNKNFSTNSQYKNLPFSNICNTSFFLPVSARAGWTKANLIRLNPWFVTGFTYAEGCFGLYIYKNKNYKTGWSINLVFQISLLLIFILIYIKIRIKNEKDINLLELFKFYFGVGGISKHGSASLKYSIRSHKDMQMIIDHFDKFPLITNKLKDYKLFKLAYILFLKKEQLSIEGIKKLVSIKSEMNLGLSLELKASFSDIIRFSQPSVEKENNTYHSLYLVEKKSYNIPVAKQLTE